MKATTALFLTVLIFLAAFTGLGYLYSQFSVQQAKIEQLQKEKLELQNDLNAMQAARQADQVKITELTDRLANAELERNHFEDIANQCQSGQQPENTWVTPKASMGILPALMALVLAGYRFLKKQLVVDQKITLRLTRKQLEDYIRYQRGVTRNSR